MTDRSDASHVQRPDDPGALCFVGESKSIPPNIAHYVSLPELEGMESIRTFFGILLAQVIRFVKTSSAAKDKSIYSRVSQSSKEGNNFDRTMTLMCLNSPPGSNTMIVTLDGRKSDEIFGQCLVARDRQGGFGPGAIVAIRGPEMIRTYFGDKAGLPVLNFSGGMKLVDQVKSKIGICTIPCSPSIVRMHGFYYTKAKLELRQMNMVATNCCGNLCDSIDMKGADGSWKSSCACFIVSKAIGSVVFDLNFTVKTEDGDFFEVLRFTSRSFTGLVTRNGIPNSINVAQLEKSGADWIIFGQLDELFKKINTSGGFDVLGWLRIGRKNDAGAPKDGTSTTVQSSDMIRHVTRLRAHASDVVSKHDTIDVEGILAKLYSNASQTEQVQASCAASSVPPLNAGAETPLNAVGVALDPSLKEQAAVGADSHSESSSTRVVTKQPDATMVTPARNKQSHSDLQC